MSLMKKQNGKFDDNQIDYQFKANDPQQQFSTRFENSTNLLNGEISPRDKFMMDYIRTSYPQISLENSQMSLEDIYHAVKDGRVAKPKPAPKQSPKKEQMFQEIEYYVKLAEADQRKEKLTKEQLMHLFKFELQQLSMSQRKQVLEEFKIGREFRETMKF